MDDNTAQQTAECPKCGSLLPSDDEGLCEVCGRAYGHATDMMPVVTPEFLRQYGIASAEYRAVQAAEQGATSEGDRSVVRLLAIAFIMLALIAGLSAVLFLSLR